MASTSEKVSQIASMMDMMLEDPTIPRNVRATIQRAKDKLVNTPDQNTGISGAVYALDEISNDINMPMHARTMVWNILSELEALRG